MVQPTADVTLPFLEGLQSKEPPLWSHFMLKILKTVSNSFSLNQQNINYNCTIVLFRACQIILYLVIYDNIWCLVKCSKNMRTRQKKTQVLIIVLRNYLTKSNILKTWIVIFLNSAKLTALRHFWVENVLNYWMWKDTYCAILYIWGIKRFGETEQA